MNSRFTRTDIINALISKINAKSYLEIGVDNGVNFNSIICQKKVGVDPVNQKVNTTATIVTATSDEFFTLNKETFDVIFIDGLHHADQVERDILNALKVLNPNGFIVCHDLNPLTEQSQIIPFVSGRWNGDCWKAFVKLRSELSDIGMLTVDTDEGCGVIWRNAGEKPIQISEELTYANLVKNRNEWLNLVSVDFFKTIILGIASVNKTNAENNYDAKLNGLLRVYVDDPSNPESNFALGLHYDSLDQKAAAVSYYTRAAERTKDPLFQYECLIKAAQCFEWQGTRGLSVRGLLQRAMTVIPSRPEAYFFLARWYERERTVESWVNCYTQACIGIYASAVPQPKLRTDVGYPGYYGLLFEKAVSGWWVGLCEEAKETFIDLHKNYPLDYGHRTAVINNLKFMKQCFTKQIVEYNKSKYQRLRYKFTDAHKIDKNYSEAYQDMFVLAMTNGKKNGTYLEIGSARPFYGNNTALLEKTFGWTGTSIDLDSNFVKDFIANRKNPCIQSDATQVDYDAILSGYPSKDIDYLQVDIDPADVSLAALKRIPFDKYRFAVITFEHDAYVEPDDKVRRESRAYLQKLGYILAGANISPDHWRYYEDWWIHPECVDTQALNILLQANDKTKTGESFILNAE